MPNVGPHVAHNLVTGLGCKTDIEPVFNTSLYKAPTLEGDDGS